MFPRDAENQRAMLSVDQAQEKILSYAGVLDGIDCPLADSLGLVLAGDVIAGLDVPPLSSATMDGYAIRAADSVGASPESPRFLRVVGAVAAGSEKLCRVAGGEAIRIMTGAAVPSGADAVVRFEDTDEIKRRGAGDLIGILKEARPGLYIRQAGDEIARGSKVLEAGRVIRPPEINLLAALGLGSVKVIRRPKVAIISTGNELVEIGRPLPPGKIYNSNCYGIAAMVKSFGGVPLVLGIAGDDEASLLAKLEEAAEADIIVTAGGTAAGDYDLVEEVLFERGEVLFTAVNMRPGGTTAFGILKMKDRGGMEKRIPHLCLPGNPTSSMVTAEVLLRPAILKMLGRQNLARPSVPAVMEEAKRNQWHSRIFTWVVVSRRDGVYYARPAGLQEKGIMTSMSRANGLAIIMEDKDAVGEGETVPVMMLNQDEAV